MEAARILKIAQEAEHARATQKAADRAKLLRREEVLLVARREAASHAGALEVT